mgnify:CR=1 FL=1
MSSQRACRRKLDPAAQAAVVDAASAMALLREQASAIKRPVVEWPDVRKGEVPERKEHAALTQTLAEAQEQLREGAASRSGGSAVWWLVLLALGTLGSGRSVFLPVATSSSAGYHGSPRSRAAPAAISSAPASPR